jgi:hypothetical protein
MLEGLVSASLLIVVATLASGCHSPGREISEPTIESSLITVEQLPAEFDAGRTYSYRASRVDRPEDLIRTLWYAGIRTRLAWEPLDDRCADPIGPRFTVELVRDNPSITEYGFDKGVGRLHCATMLMAYEVSDGGS